MPSTNTPPGNTLGAATNTLGKGVGTVTDAAGNIVTTTGKGVGDTVTGLTQGLGDTTKGMSLSRVLREDVVYGVRMALTCGLAGGNFVKDTGRSGTDHLGLTEAEKREQGKQ